MNCARPQNSETSARHSAFYNIENPREQRLLAALLQRGWTSRHDLDRLVGCENTPDLVMRVRRKFGLEIDMERRPLVDRDGFKTRPGFYCLTPADRQKAVAALGRGSA